MELLALSLVLIGVLYWRTLSYLNLIDDIVPMSGYLYIVPQTTPVPDFHLQKSPRSLRIRAIGMHCLNTTMVYLILGGKACLLFAVFPIAVNNVAWITGSYYSCTTFLSLVAYYFLTHAAWFLGVPLAMCFFAAALNSTVATISFPFIFLAGNPIGLSLILPLIIFLKGRRFSMGKKIRESPQGAALPVLVLPDVFTYRRLALMTKVVGLYLYTCLVPLKLLFFRHFGEQCRFNPEVLKDLESFNKRFYLSLGFIGAFIGVSIYLKMFFWAAWFLVLISAFSQFKFLGQFFAERYIYPASIGIIAMLSLLPDQAYWMLVGLYILRTHFFIPVFESNKTLYENGIKLDPDEPSNYCNLSDWYLMVERNYSLAGHFIQVHTQKDPQDYKADINMASLWRILGNFPMALEHGKKAVQKGEGRAWPHTMQIMQSQLEQTERAIHDTKQKQAHAV